MAISGLFGLCRNIVAGNTTPVVMVNIDRGRNDSGLTQARSNKRRCRLFDNYSITIIKPRFINKINEKGSVYFEKGSNACTMDKKMLLHRYT